MENINGALAFQATLDINDFNVSADAMERHIRQVSTSTQVEAESMEQSLLDFAQKGAMYIQAYLVGQGMANLLNSIVQVRGQFQQLEIAFGTMLGSETKAKVLMDQMIETAAKTPFDLMGVASGAKQLLAYGTAADKVNDTLVRLGNIASGLSIPLNDIVYLYGTTMVQGRLYAQDVRQFTGRGIPLVKELAAMYGVTAEEINNMVSAGKIGFPDVEKVINKLTDSGGQFYNLMEKQSASLTGMISNLEDAWDGMLNDIGTQNQDVFGAAISSASYLVEHYQQILDILKAVTIAYGSYKAAIVLNTLVTKGYTGVALIDNTVRQAKIAYLKAEAVATGQVAAQTKAMQVAEEAHVVALERELTAEELANVKKQLRIATIQSLLTAQQAEYISNLGLTASSESYEAAAMGVLSVEQQQAVKKLDLSSKSAIYRAALEQEVMAKRENTTATLENIRAEVSAAARKVEATKAAAVSAMQKTEAARYEVYWTRQSGDATALSVAQKKLEAATDNQATARKAALAAQTDFYTKKKLLETTASRQSTIASQADTVAKTTQTTATNILSAATSKATLAVKTLWAAFKANPFGWIVTAIGMVISALSLFQNQEDEATGVMGEFQDATKKEIDNLELLFAVINNTEENTKTHKDAIEKVNEVCKEYNKTLLDENATLVEQKAKYNELRKAIQETTAEKIKAKYVEQALQELIESSNDNFDKFVDRIEEASYKTGKKKTITDRAHGETYEVDVTATSENIRNMGAQVQEAIRGQIEESAKLLSTMSGEAFTKEYDNVVSSILASTQAATKATDAEIAGFKGTVESYLNSQIEKTKDYNATVNTVTNSLNAFYAPKDPTPIVESTDYVAMSFEDLQTKIENNQKEIDNLNAKIIDPKTNPTQLDSLKAKLLELLNLQAQLNGAVVTKSNNLNTDEGINERIKQLRQLISTEEYGSKKRKEYADELIRLQKRQDANNLTKTGGRSGGRSGRSGGTGGGRSNTANYAETLAQRQLEAQRNLEEARIEVMDEGYAKRKAKLDLQHKEALDRIKKEESELEKAYKKAGKKGGLSADEKAGFQERRDLENKSYETESSKLFDGEIEYKKKQYEAYFNWVRNVGQDVADAHFKELLKDGNSFTAWINSQLAELEAKKETGTLTDGDANALNALKIQKDELTGTKSAMDLFKDSLSKTVGQAKTLAEKLQAIADLKDKLARGEFHLNNDETAAAALILNSQETDLNNQVDNEVLQNYRTYEEQKLDIQNEYQLLRLAAQRSGNAERVRLVNEGEEAAISALNAAFLKQSDSWKRLFGDLDSLSAAHIDKLIHEIEEKLKNADLKLNPVDYKAVIDSLNKAKEALIQKNPFKALGSFYDDYIAAKKKLADAKANLAAGKGSQSDVDQAQSDIKKASKRITQSIEQVTSMATECGQSLADMFDALGMEDAAEGLGTAIELVGQLGNAASSVGKLMSGDIIGGVTGIVSSVTSVVGIFAKLHDKKYEKRIKALQDEIDKLERSYSRLERAFNNTYWVFSDEQRAGYEKNIQLIQEQIKALEKEAETAKKTWRFGDYAKINKEIKELQKTLQAAQEKGDMFSIYEAQKANLRQQQKDIEAQIQNERSKKKTNNDAIKQWEDQIEQINQQIEDLDKQMMETLAGTTVQSAIDEFASALVDAYCQGEDAAEALGEKTKAVLKNAVVEALKRQFLAKGINDAVEYLGEAMKDNKLTDDERAHFTAMVNQAGDLFNTALDGIGDWIKDAEESVDPLKGAVSSMSEETAGVIAGRLNAFIINQGDQTAQLRAILIYQAQISANTKSTVTELQEIKSELKAIRNSGNSLLSQGIS